MAGKMKNPDLVKRALARTVAQPHKKGLGGLCKVWIGAVDRQGYPRISVEGRSKPARREVFKAHFGYNPPPDIWVVTNCHNQLCLNPDHLEALPRGEALARSPKVQAFRRGE